MGTEVATPTCVQWGIDGWGARIQSDLFFLLPHPCPLPCWGIWEILDPYSYPAELAVLKALDEEVGGTRRTCRPSVMAIHPLLPRFPDAPMGGVGIAGGKPQRPLSSYLLAEAWGAPGNPQVISSCFSCQELQALFPGLA